MPLLDEFTWDCEAGPSRPITPRVFGTKFGDGYEQRVGDGINTILEQWSLTFIREVAEITAIDDFLKARGGVYSFVWTAPDEVQGSWLCRTWTRSIPVINVQTLTATFERTFD